MHADGHGFGNAKCPITPFVARAVVSDHKHTRLGFKQFSDRVRREAPRVGELFWRVVSFGHECGIVLIRFVAISPISGDACIAARRLPLTELARLQRQDLHFCRRLRFVNYLHARKSIAILE